jgi:hypothetical protein
MQETITYTVKPGHQIQIPVRIAVKDWCRCLVGLDSIEDLNNFRLDVQDSPMDLKEKALALEWAGAWEKELEEA